MRSIVVARSLVFASLLCVFFAIPSVAAVVTIDGVWSSLNGPAPDARREYAAVYDREAQRYVMFAGFTNEQGGGYFLFNEVWVLTLDGSPGWWGITIPGDVPGGRHSPQWGYDPARNRVLIFGGYGSHHPGDPYAYLNDVWELNLDGAPSWNELVPTGTPPAGRLAGVAVFDVLHQRFVGFGGTAGLPVDTWQLDLRDIPAWSTIETNGVEPLGSYGMTSIFDPARNRMLIFGGSTTADYYGTHNDTWELNLKPDVPVWRQMSPSGTLPIARRTLTSVFDARRDRMVIFGGWDGSPDSDAFLNDTWALSLSSGDGEWTQLSPAGALPHVRDAMAAVYDPGADRMVLFGGWGGNTMLGDTQFLTWGDSGPAASATSSAAINNGVAHLQWTTQNTVSPIGAVYRRQAGTEWTSIGTFEADGSGHVSFQDGTITPGEDYGYQIIVTSRAGDQLVGEVWLDAATNVGTRSPSAALALQVWPNPATGAFGISFASLSNEPTRLEMFDVRGQRVLARDVNARRGGTPRLHVGDAKDFPSGVYFVRLTQSGFTATSRLVLVR